MNTEAVVTPYEGSGSLGPVFGGKETVEGRFEGKRRRITRSDGTDIISSGTFMTRPDVSIPMLSEIEINGRTYTVAEVLPGEGLNRTEYIEHLLT
jgi:hypothetical protein